MMSLRKKLLKLEMDVNKALRQAEKTDTSEDWASWKEADCLRIGYWLALNDLENILRDLIL